MFREALITAPPRRSQKGMFNCVPHHTVLINKVTAFTERAQNVCRVCIVVCFRAQSFHSSVITAPVLYAKTEKIN